MRGTLTLLVALKCSIWHTAQSRKIMLFLTGHTWINLGHYSHFHKYAEACFFVCTPQAQKTETKPEFGSDFLFWRQNLIFIFAGHTSHKRPKIKIRFCSQIWTEFCFCFCFCPSGKIQNLIKIFTKRKSNFIAKTKDSMSQVLELVQIHFSGWNFNLRNNQIFSCDA